VKDLNKVDLGSIKIHKQVLADIIQSAVLTVPGVTLLTKDFGSHLVDLVGVKKIPGISITIAKNSQVTIEVKVKVRLGLNIHDVAQQIQEVVRAAIDKTVDIDLKDINVNIQGIERGES
jgi:uncharacterized alkaline shock family protein YloU